MPNANRMTVGIMAVIAEEERRMIGERTKAAGDGDPFAGTHQSRNFVAASFVRHQQ
jgi:DNA invertase Pin-like site-specific DNA recombinase